MAGLSVPYEFATCITPTSDGSLVGAGTAYPIAFTKDQLFELVYRVYSTQYEIEATFDNPDGPFVGSATYTDLRLDGEMDYDDGITSYTGITDEQDLACAIIPSIIQVNDSAGSTIEISTVLNLLGGVYLYSGSYYPTVTFDIKGAAGSEFKFNSVSGVYGTTLTSGVLSIFGNPMNLYSLDSSTTITGTLVFSYYRWWPYDPGSGGPIWDATTGAMLRDPFSVQTWT